MIHATGLGGVIGRHLVGRVSGISFLDFCKSGVLEFSSAEKAETLIHLAGIVGQGLIEADPYEAWRVNVGILPEFLQLLAQQGLVHFVYISSGHVYGNVDGQVADETSDVNPLSIYGRQKVEAEALLTSECNRLGVKLTILRAFSILGPEMPDFSLAGALRASILRNQPLKFADDVRDFLSPVDMAVSILKLASMEESYNFGIINVCSGLGYTIGETALKFRARFYPDSADPVFSVGNSNFPRLVGGAGRLQRLLGNRAPLPPDWLWRNK